MIAKLINLRFQISTLIKDHYSLGCLPDGNQLLYLVRFLPNQLQLLLILGSSALNKFSLTPKSERYESNKSGSKTRSEPSTTSSSANDGETCKSDDSETV